MCDDTCDQTLQWSQEFQYHCSCHKSFSIIIPNYTTTPLCGEIILKSISLNHAVNSSHHCLLIWFAYATRILNPSHIYISCLQECIRNFMWSSSLLGRLSIFTKSNIFPIGCIIHFIVDGMRKVIKVCGTYDVADSRRFWRHNARTFCLFSFLPHQRGFLVGILGPIPICNILNTIHKLVPVHLKIFPLGPLPRHLYHLWVTLHQLGKILCWRCYSISISWHNRFT